MRTATLTLALFGCAGASDVALDPGIVVDVEYVHDAISWRCLEPDRVALDRYGDEGSQWTIGCDLGGAAQWSALVTIVDTEATPYNPEPIEASGTFVDPEEGQFARLVVILGNEEITRAPEAWDYTAWLEPVDMGCVGAFEASQPDGWVRVTFDLSDVRF